MVGLVIVSHSKALAESVVELAKGMAPQALMAAAGGLEDGSFGSSFDRIRDAILSVYSEDGVLVFMDLGSSVMTAEMVLEEMEGKKVSMVDCPIVEGAVTAAALAECGMNFERVKEDAENAGKTAKLAFVKM